MGNAVRGRDADLLGPLRSRLQTDWKIAVKPDSTRTEELPIYESLIRERGDVVEEARVVAEETQHQMSLALSGVAPAPQETGAS